MTDILQLPGWKVSKTYEDATERTIEAAFTEPADACQKCGVIGALYKHGTKALSFRDTPMFGKHVMLKATVQRYRCRECGETFIQELAGIDPDRRMTTRCVEFIQSQCVRDSFTRLAEHVGCVEGTVRNLATERFERFDSGFKPYLPEWMGMDETKLDGAMRGVIADVGNRKPLDILRDREKPTIIKWLSQFKDKTIVKGLAIDMWKPYRDAAQIVFPGLPVVIDKFHIVRMANYSLEEVRIKSQADREKGVRVAWKRSRLLLLARYKNLSDKARFNLGLDNEADIREAYWLKERLFDLFDMPKAEAITAYDAYADSVPASMKKQFNELTRAMRNWRTEILNYFDYPITNGYTEALNGSIKVVNRNARGYSFDVLRAKVLSKNKLLHPAIVAPVEPLMARTTADPHVVLMDVLGNRCECCGGLFEGMQLEAHHITAEQTGDRSRNLYLCPSCHKRFHTEGVSHRNQLST
jgi:transposase